VGEDSAVRMSSRIPGERRPCIRVRLCVCLCVCLCEMCGRVKDSRAGVCRGCMRLVAREKLHSHARCLAPTC
jgi:hypothetical protein